MFDIDIVIPWVDGGDKDWIKERLAHQGAAFDGSSVDVSANRYRDWENLQYIFRGIERFMPWVRRVHFITNGQKPTWLNLDHPKLNFVTHADYIPQEYLPTFSAHPIELNLHRIGDLAEHFIYFNDDTFITRDIDRFTYFSSDGYPKDQSAFLRVPGASYDDVYGHILLNDIGVINQNFSRNATVKQHFRKLFSPKNGFLAPFLSASYLPTNHFPGFVVTHMPQPLLKSVIAEVWAKEHDILHETSMRKFRDIRDINQYVFREWQFVTGRYTPANVLRHARYFSVFPEQLGPATNAITSGKFNMICINDSKVADFEEAKSTINKAFADILPNPSSFELKESIR